MQITPHRRWLACLPILFALASSRAAGPNDTLAVQRAEFRQANERTAGAAATSPVADSANLRSYVLYPYLQAARLAQALTTAGINVPTSLDEQIATFLRSRDAEPVAQDLRRSWLGNLATRAQWSQFLAFHRDASDGTTLRCQGFTARIELQRTDGLAAEIAQTWLTPRSLPECDRAFEWLRASGGLGNTLIERRVRLALEGGNAAFARQIAPRLPTEQAKPLLQWIALLENPRREIDALIAAPGTAVETPTLLAGWTALARADRTAAKQRYEKLLRARNLDERAASPFALALALALSWDRDTETLQYFARVVIEVRSIRARGCSGLR
jgi:soluble lytic murein transglycosylase